MAGPPPPEPPSPPPRPQARARAEAEAVEDTRRLTIRGPEKTPEVHSPPCLPSPSGGNPTPTARLAPR